MNYEVFFACQHPCCLSGTSGLGYFAGGSLGVATAESMGRVHVSSIYLWKAWLLEADRQSQKLPCTGSFLQIKCFKTSVIFNGPNLKAKPLVLSAQTSRRPDHHRIGKLWKARASAGAQSLQVAAGSGGDKGSDTAALFPELIVCLFSRWTH